MEGGFIGVIADKVYHVHPGVLALITAAPMFGLLSSFVWAQLALGRRKVPFTTSLRRLAESESQRTQARGSGSPCDHARAWSGGHS